jgi:predicted DNA-binding transcriptional regulator YafY
MPKKSKAVNTAMRYNAILQLIPEWPGRISTSHIIRRLGEDNEKYGVTPRSIQRDLATLSQIFPISSNRDVESRSGDSQTSSKKTGRLKYWFFLKGEPMMQIPIMGQSTALALRLAKEYLTSVMPASALELLERYFKHANQVLAGTKLAKWPTKVKIIHRGPALIPPKIDPRVQSVVYQGILESKKISVTYLRRGGTEPKTYTLNPLGIVSKDGLFYLVATVWNYDDPGQYALHRIKKAELQEDDARVPAGFDLNRYVYEEKEFSYPHSKRKIKFRAHFSSEVGYHLYESRLSEDQSIRQLPSGRLLVTATLDETDELIWWILGFGNNVEVKYPPKLRRAISDILRQSLALYKN